MMGSPQFQPLTVDPEAHTTMLWLLPSVVNDTESPADRLNCTPDVIPVDAGETPEFLVAEYTVEPPEDHDQHLRSPELPQVVDP